LKWYFNYGRATVREWRRGPDIWGISRRCFTFFQIARGCAAGKNSDMDRSPETAAEGFLQVLGLGDDWPNPGDLPAVAQPQGPQNPSRRASREMNVTVILCTYNRCQSLAKALETAAALRLPEWDDCLVGHSAALQLGSRIRGTAP
jgi:hypothetical protein